MSKSNLPVLLLKNLVLFPLGEARIELNNNITKDVMDISKKSFNSHVLVVTPLNYLEEVPDTNDLPKVGVVARIRSRIDLPNGNSRIVLVGLNRVRVLKYMYYPNKKDILESEIINFPSTIYNEVEEIALLRKLKEMLETYIQVNPMISNAVLNRIKGINDLDKLTDTICNFVNFNINKKVNLVVEANKINRARKLIDELNVEIAISRLENKIELNLRSDLDQMQKEMYLKEKIKVIKKELGSVDNKSIYIDKINEILNNRHIPIDIKERLKLEVNKYESTLDTSPEIGTIKSYIDYLVSIPFGKVTKDEKDLNKVSESLNKTHYGLDEVKERILEYVAVETNKESNNPVICLVGPPGVGKTTLAESIALSLNKKFDKISLGGLNDPAELLGHRKTYIGSEPGKIITSLVKSGVMNPVILLDEVDKMSKDYKGDPVNALLDILDSKQNKDFVDNYIEEKIDLSKVTWILTANDKSMIPLVLQDRLDIIELNSYLNYEKIRIAKDYLINNALIKNGVDECITFSEEAILKLIEDYTKESGVRELDRLINRIIRKIVTKYKLDNKNLVSTTVTPEMVKEYLGIEKYVNNDKISTERVGYVKGLAYTPYGGETLEIEVTGYKGKDAFLTSGHLGETLKESIMVSLGYIKSNMKLFNIAENEFNKTLHINFREGGIPKEGPSAGTIITTAILSFLLKKEVPTSISSSGEITLLGDVLPVGGLREKSLAAIKSGITKVYLSSKNKRDIEFLDKEIKDKIEFVFVNNYIEIYNDIFKGDDKSGRDRKNEND